MLTARELLRRSQQASSSHRMARWWQARASTLPSRTRKISSILSSIQSRSAAYPMETPSSPQPSIKSSTRKAWESWRRRRATQTPLVCSHPRTRRATSVTRRTGPQKRQSQTPTSRRAKMHRITPRAPSPSVLTAARAIKCRPKR